MANVVVWPNKYVTAWSGGTEGITQDAIPLHDALTRHYVTDAHCPGYTIPGESGWPRIKVDALPLLQDMGREPLMETVFVDVDLPGHRAWADDAEHRQVFDDVCKLFPAAGVYTTAHGFRLVFALGEPIRASLYRSWYVPFLRDYVRLAADEQCADWTRGFRLPHVVREGGVTHVPLCAFRAIEEGVTLDWMPSTPLREESRALVVQEAPAPEPLPTDHAAWRQVRDHTVAGGLKPSLQGGELLDFAVGERHRRWVQLVASIVAQVRPVDAVIIFRMVVTSALADTRPGATTLDKIWDIVCNRASLEAEGDEPAPPARPGPTQPLIVNVGQTFYVQRPGGGYSFALNKGNLVAEISRLQPGLPVFSRNGSPWSAPRILTNYGRVAEEVVYDVTEDVGRFRFDTLRLHVPGCVMREVEAAYDPDVERWLAEFGADHQDDLLDWLATFRDLRVPTACLYAQGPRGAGKGMLASALAQFWGDAPTAFRTATARFNWRLKDQPFVHLDEGIAMTPEMSSRFRSMVSEVVHEIEGKNLPHASLLGALRLLVTANNASAIELHGVYSAEDVKAIAARILHVAVGKGASSYLAFLGGRAFTAEWVRMADGTPGAICKHVVWLEQTRQVARGNRFAVEGKWRAYHTGLISSPTLHSQILIAIAYAIAPIGNGGLSVWDGIVPDQDYAYVNATILHKHWKDLLPHEDRIKPSSAVVTKSLKALAADEASRVRRFVAPSGRSRQLRYWRVKADLILRTAKEQGYPGYEELARKLGKNVNVVQLPNITQLP